MGDGGDAEGEGFSELRGGGGVTINIRSSNGSKFAVQIDLESTVESFKAVLAGKCDIAAGQQRLIYKGRILKDDQILKSYGLEADHSIHLVRGFALATSTNHPPAAAVATNTGESNNTQGNAREAGSIEGGELGGSGYGASLFSGLGMGALSRTGGLFGAGPELEQMQQQLTQNPNIMRDIMNMPLVQNLMNIEATPEGFNMLRHMYETVQEPFLNATTMGGNTGSDGSNPLSALLGTQGGNQPRDGSASPSTTGSETTAGSPVPNSNPLPNPWTSAGTGSPQTNTTRSNTALGAARQQPPDGLGGLGLPELEGMLGAMPDPSLITQLMQNPAISQMMQSVFSNPQYMNQILGLNPQLHSMLDSNPQLREIFQNPELLHQMTSPETMQQLLTMQQSVISLLGQQQSTQEPGQNRGGSGTVNNAGLEMVMNMFGGLGAGSLAVPTRSNVPPEELYATQLTQLQEMGFFDTQENLRALIATAGNVHAAVERLLSNSGL